jgi:hypothetical protein
MRDLRFGIPSRGARVRVFGALTGAALVLGAGAVYELVHHSDAADARPQAVAVAPLLSQAAFQHRSGVRIVRVAVSGDGGLVDLRYRVIDPNAATSIHDKARPPQIVDERTKVLVSELLMGHAHRGRLKAAQTYYLIFNNPGNLVRRGSRVTVQLGAARVAHVPVQ